MRPSSSNVFNRIRQLVQDGELDNRAGFSPAQVRQAAPELHTGTVGTFLPKHCRVRNIYFQRMRTEATYRIRREWL